MFQIELWGAVRQNKRTGEMFLDTTSLTPMGYSAAMNKAHSAEIYNPDLAEMFPVKRAVLLIATEEPGALPGDRIQKAEDS